MEEMPKTYDTAAVEQRMLDKWLELSLIHI